MEAIKTFKTGYFCLKILEKLCSCMPAKKQLHKMKKNTQTLTNEISGLLKIVGKKLTELTQGNREDPIYRSKKKY